MGTGTVSGHQGKLVIVGTPIGNLGDLTPRARQALERADAICAEDTRVTGQLLAALNLSKPLERLDENVMAERIPAVLNRIDGGATVAFCSDAGMPAISDPGARLIAAAREAGLTVEITPGPSAADTAFVASGCTEKDFYFGGFLPKKAGALAARLEALAPLEAALIFFESPHRLAATIDTIGVHLPERRVWICRELTKLHEEILSGMPEALHATLAQRAREGRPLKGEITLVIDGPSERERSTTSAAARKQAEILAATLLEADVAPRTVAAVVTQHCGLVRNVSYELVQRLANRTT